MRQIYCNNGQVEYLFGDEKERFREIVEEQIGRDAAQAFDEIIENERTNEGLNIGV